MINRPKQQRRSLRGAVLAVSLLFPLALTGAEEGAALSVPWSAPLRGLSIRLVVEETTLKAGAYPWCRLQARNMSDALLLLDKSFSFYQPGVRDSNGVRRPNLVFYTPADDPEPYRRLQPGQTISVRVMPVQHMRAPGRYTSCG